MQGTKKILHVNICIICVGKKDFKVEQDKGTTTKTFEKGKMNVDIKGGIHNFSNKSQKYLFYSQTGLQKCVLRV